MSLEKKSEEVEIVTYFLCNFNLEEIQKKKFVYNNIV